jgi:hypothetical protein
VSPSGCARKHFRGAFCRNDGSAEFFRTPQLSAAIRAIRGKHSEAFKPLMSAESRRDLQKDLFFSLQGEKLSLHLAAILL